MLCDVQVELFSTFVCVYYCTTRRKRAPSKMLSQPDCFPNDELTIRRKKGNTEAILLDLTFKTFNIFLSVVKYVREDRREEGGILCMGPQ